MNQVNLIGNLTKDPELNTTTNGIAVCKFTIAVNRDYTNQQGERDADFIPIVTWRNQAENCYDYLNKGSKVAVTGSISTRNYENDEGKRVFITEVNATRVQFLNTRNNSDHTEKKSEKSEKKVEKITKKLADMNPADEPLPF